MSWRWRDDPWLTERLGLPARELFLPQSAPGCTRKSFLPPPPQELDASFVYIRLPVKQVNTLTGLMRVGFRLVDTSVTLERPAAPQPVAPSPAFTVRPAGPEDKDAVVELARHAYHLTRFHQDPCIAKTVADDIQACWAANFFNGGRGDLLLVGERQRRVVGFHLALTPDAHTLVVDLVAVVPEAQGLGMGRALIDTAQRTANRPLARVGTQLANAASLAFYQRLGFIHKRAAHTLHRHPQL